MNSACRICNSENPSKIGEYCPDNKDKFDIYFCRNCGNRFTFRQHEIHESLHQNNQSTYWWHSKYAGIAKSYFKTKNERQLRQFLSKEPKNKFIIDEILGMGKKNLSILEIGCSDGYLTSYFLLSGYNIIGTDISPSAVKKATENFGNHFQVLNDDILSRFGLFDIIFHVGTIGCVEDPIGFTANLMKYLHHRGILLFNSSNLAALEESGDLWVSTPPPDIINVFSESFWQSFFKNTAEVSISYEPYDHRNNFKKILSRIYNKGKKPTSNYNRTDKSFDNNIFRQNIGDYLEIFAAEMAKSFIPKTPLEFGMFVTMKKIN